MKSTFLKYTVFGTLAISSFTLAGCLKDNDEEIIDHVNTEASIYVLRSNYKGSDIRISESTLEGASTVGGVVISNHENKNLTPNTIAVQSTWRGKTRGILVQVDQASKYTFGDSISMQLVGSTLSGSEGALRVKDLAADKISIISKGNNKAYLPVAITNLHAKPGDFESTLISITADVDPEPSKGQTIAGEHTLVDSENKKIVLSTNKEATFSELALSPSATFQGIFYSNQGQLELRMQKAEDLTFPSGKIYAGWPETFEEPYQQKTGYAAAVINFPTGPWNLNQSLQGNTAGRDRIVSGKQSIRFQQNLSTSAYLQMNFDLPDGASKVTLWYGAYYTDRSSTFQLESSIDQGKTWQIVGKPISDAHPTSQSLVAKQAIFLMDIDQPVRFRINKLGLGTSSNTVNNGRLGMDDFAIYKSY
ncbi:DUF5689 domain-containing protein [Sphingobacterium psychroaquaticum]|uniref:Uncharacterized protein n=1 Tax=Sphingobacterium psychroaquaticum TaxID=561061 RepID=A0A1X7I2S6_9SPHI|nr:DUF5689 domain-containing protein [Sphingobacterium psychroaquaticum]QBQ41975.1 hypothetical protein E2P86_12765 [Sphingobacterium psychroaquaticum]SMG08651.1 hypothetical protein SAMN05660862_0393 [Sphingobacterium psychroaquaticum]